MKITLKKTTPNISKNKFLVFPAVAAKKKTSSKGLWSCFAAETKAELQAFDRQYQKALSKQLKLFSFSAKSGANLDLALAQKSTSSANVRLFAMGSVEENQWRKLGGDAFRTAQKQKVSTISISLRSVAKKNLPAIVQAVIVGAELASYSYTKYKKSSNATGPKELELLIKGSNQTFTPSFLKQAQRTAHSVCFARDLVNDPPSDLIPADLVKAARQIAQQSKGRVKTRVFTDAALKKMGANALLAVSRGSASKPFLIHMSYKTSSRSQDKKTIVLIGKGVTFDSGGLSIKTGKGMEDMKCDMAGAACVLGVMKALSKLPQKQILHDIHVLVPTSENMVSAKSVKPGDVVRAMNGKSIEILNTDAEGRLLLADALCYSARLKADITIDLATLTGSCLMALGSDYAGLFSDEEELLEDLIECGAQEGRKPLAPPTCKRISQSTQKPNCRHQKHRHRPSRSSHRSTFPPTVRPRKHLLGPHRHRRPCLCEQGQ